MSEEQLIELGLILKTGQKLNSIIIWSLPLHVILTKKVLEEE